jgi:hypothetical protein
MVLLFDGRMALGQYVLPLRRLFHVAALLCSSFLLACYAVVGGANGVETMSGAVSAHVA